MGLPHPPRRPRARARAADATVGTRPLAREARQGDPVSTVAPLVHELGPAPDPLDACARFRDLPFLLFLDSAPPTDPQHLGRYSFLAADPATAVRSKGLLTQELVDGSWIRVAGDPLAHIGALVAAHATAPVAELPPFQGGAAGYVAYDWGMMLERVPRPRYDDLAVPDLLLGLYDWVIAWDHAAGRAWVISTGIPERGEARERRAAQRLAFVNDRLRGPGAGGLPARQKDAVAPGAPPHQARSSAAPSYPVPDVPGVRSNFTHEGYLDAVARVIEYVYAGDIFQANLSQRLQAPLVGTPLDLYRRLRNRNPAPFSAYLDFGDLVVASSSPERFLRVHPGGGVETRPIKGTRPRGLSPEHDAALARALVESDKDRAENVMIVDLLRNDLSRVCRPGTVRVPELFAIELAHHGGDEVVDRGVVLFPEHPRHAHRPRPTHARQVVPEEVHDHHVLGPVLVALYQGAGQRRVVLGGEPARTGSLDGPGLDPAVRLHLQEALGGRARDDQVAEIEKGGEGRGVTLPQPAVQVERRADEWGLEPLRQVRLEDIARVNVLDDAGHGVEVALAREIRPDARDVGHRIRWSGGASGLVRGGSRSDCVFLSRREPPRTKPPKPIIRERQPLSCAPFARLSPFRNPRRDHPRAARCVVPGDHPIV